jgi:IS5 family transposase
LRDWQQAGGWQAIHRTLLDRLGARYRIDWSRAALDSASVPAPAGGEHTGKHPTDRAKLGTKHHLIVDSHGVPLAATHSAANVHDSKLLEATVDAIGPCRMPYGRPRRRPDKLHADKGDDFRSCRTALRQRGITPRIARRGIESAERLGRFRWIVERTLSWLHRFRRLRIRYERRADLHLAFLPLGCALICWTFLQ